MISFKLLPIQHFSFWLVSFLILATFFAEDYSNIFTKINWIYTLLFHLSLFWVVYVNLLLGLPHFLQKRKYILYTLLMVVNLAIGISLNIFTFSQLSDYLFPGYFFISYYEWKDILVFLVAYWVLSTLLEWSKAWFQLIENKKRLRELEKEKLAAELKALKSQINPHFLFNSLNNLYSLAMDSDKRTPSFLLKLAQSMRYMLYESNEALVTLEKEIDYLNNYLELQQLRLENAKIHLYIKGNAKNKKIAPLLFIPFVENAFKHGLKGDTENVFVNIQLDIREEEVIFQIKNNKGELDPFLKEEHRGIGLTNVKKRLDLLYPEQHQLAIKEDEKTFDVLLKIAFSFTNHLNNPA